MSFDQRRNRISGGGPARQVQTGRVSQTEREGRSPVLVMAGVAAGLVCIALLFSGYVSGMRQVGKKLNEKFEAQMDESISPTPQLALLKTASAQEWTLGNCTMTGPPSAADLLMPDKYTGRNHEADQARTITGGYMSEELLNAATFIECVADYEPQQLCQPEVRNAFATDVIAFYHQHVATTRIFAQNSPRVMSSVAEAMAKAAGDDASAVTSNINGTIEREMSDAKDKVDQALEEAISNGYVSNADFGWMTPTQVHEVFKRSHPKTAACEQKP
jgi:hypothetical protein